MTWRRRMDIHHHHHDDNSQSISNWSWRKMKKKRFEFELTRSKDHARRCWLLGFVARHHENRTPGQMFAITWHPSIDLPVVIIKMEIGIWRRDQNAGEREKECGTNSVQTSHTPRHFSTSRQLLSLFRAGWDPLKRFFLPRHSYCETLSGREGGTCAGHLPSRQLLLARLYARSV